MMDLTKYELDEYRLLIVDNIRLAMSPDYLNEAHLRYKGKYFSIEPVKGKVVVFAFGQRQEFDNVDDMLENCVIDGKPFMEALKDVESEDFELVE